MEDDDVTVSAVSRPSGGGASHRITIDDHGTPYVYWYGKRKPTCMDFRKVTHMALVKDMHSIGPSMNIAATEAFHVQGTRYVLIRRTAHEFTIETLD